MTGPAAITSEQHAARIARIREERKAAGRSPCIESPVVYQLLDAVLAANQKTTKKS